MKKEESRGFDVFSSYVFCFWKREKMCKELPNKEPNPKKSSFFFGLKVPRAFYSLVAHFEAAPLVGPPFLNGFGSS